MSGIVLSAFARALLGKGRVTAGTGTAAMNSTHRHQRKTGETHRWLHAVLILTSLNAIIYIGIGMYMGGIAAPDESGGGEYYLAQGTTLVQVTSEVFTYSLWHGAITLQFLFWLPVSEFLVAIQLVR